MTNSIDTFKTLLRSTNREGMETLIKWLDDSDFFTAPASTRYHSCHKGGLLEHSLNVYRCLKEKANQPIWKEVFAEIGEDSLIIAALLHDICKANFYEIEYRNKKIYSEHGLKKDEAGRFDWQSVPCYTINDQNPLGHGSKSVIILQNFINLKSCELYMILYHMGFSEPKETYNSLGSAIKLHPEIIAINEADLEAAYLLEEEN